MLFVNICLNFAGDFVRVPDWTAVVVVEAICDRASPRMHRDKSMMVEVCFVRCQITILEAQVQEGKLA